jgi:hypothetical protein
MSGKDRLDKVLAVAINPGAYERRPLPHSIKLGNWSKETHI